MEESDWLFVVRLHVRQANTCNMANWSDKEIETVIEGTFTRVGYPAVNLEQLDAVIVKGKDVFFSVPMGSGKFSVMAFYYLCSTPFSGATRC